MKDYAIILAADLPQPEQVSAIVKKVGKIVDGIKIGAATLLQAGTGILPEIKRTIGDNPLLVDLKIADIGFLGRDVWQGTNSKIIKSIADSGTTHVTVHGFPGPLSVAEAVGEAGAAGIGVLLLPLMSHAGAGLFFSRPLSRSDFSPAAAEAGLDLKLPDDLQCSDVTEGILLMGEALNVAGYIGPATRPADLQRYRRLTRKPIWCPGFGRQDRQGRSLQEQFRQWAGIVGKSSAAIVGSAIFGAEDPVRAAQEIMETRDKALEILR